MQAKNVLAILFCSAIFIVSTTETVMDFDLFEAVGPVDYNDEPDWSTWEAEGPVNHPINYFEDEGWT